MKISLRLARIDELEEILEVEFKAGHRFQAYGLGPPGEEEMGLFELLSGSEHKEGIEQKRLWVATLPDNTIAGFALAQIIDEEGHLREIDVLQEYGRQGIGRALIEHVMQWCLLEGYPSLTLTTFKDIPWNCPYYEKLGFRIIDEAALSGRLQEMIAEEKLNHDLERVAMRKIISS